MRRPLLPILALLASLLLAACADEGSAPQAIESYLKAKVAADETKLVQLSCAAWEAQARLDAAPFKAVTAEIEAMTCREAGQEDDFHLVTCEGTLTIQYRGEDPRQQPLGGTTYRAVREDGTWKMCGEE
jgi:hypothetical protein